MQAGPIHSAAVDQYLRHYYGCVSTENGWLMQRLHSLYEKCAPCGRMLELGGGPTIYQLIDAALYVDVIVFTDRDSAHLAAVTAWRDRESTAFDWQSFFDVAATLTGYPAANLAGLVRRRLAEFMLLDVVDLSGPVAAHRYGVVSSMFCLESAVSSREALAQLLREVGALVDRDGILVLGVLRNCQGYRVADGVVPTVSVDEAFLETTLSAVGFGDIDLETFPADGRDGYDGLMVLGARRQGYRPGAGKTRPAEAKGNG